MGFTKFLYRGGFPKLLGASYTHTGTDVSLFLVTDMKEFCKGPTDRALQSLPYRLSFIKPLGNLRGLAKPLYRGCFVKALGIHTHIHACICIFCSSFLQRWEYS